MDVGKSTYVVYDPSYEAEWTSAISSVLGDHYERVASHQLIGIFLIVFANKALIPAITSVQQSHLPTGVFSLLGNKGGTAIRMQCYDTTICFVNVHLYHVAEAAQRRTGDARRILRELVFDDAESIEAHDHIFFFGDLNYRVSRLVFAAHLHRSILRQMKRGRCSIEEPWTNYFSKINYFIFWNDIKHFVDSKRHQFDVRRY